MKRFFLVVMLISWNAFAQETQEASAPAPAVSTSPAVATEVAPAPPVVSPPPAVATPVPPQAAVPAPPPVEVDDRKIRVAVMGYFSSANQLKFDSVVGTSGSGSDYGKATFNTDSALGIGIEVYESRKNHWGWALGATYDFQRKINSASSNSNGTTSSAVYLEPKPTITVVTSYANVIYRWEQFYLPIGLNISYIELQPTGSATINSQSAIGAQLGFGMQVTENIGIEFISRAAESRITSTLPTTAIDYGTGQLSGAQMIFKVSF